MANEAANLQRRKCIEIGPNIGGLSLHLRVQGGRILVRASDVGDAREDETEGILKEVTSTDEHALKERQYTASFLNRLRTFFQL